MNVNQMARNQQMLYRFIDRSAGSSYASQLSPLSGLGTANSGDKTSSLLQGMGISGLQGRTVREMAQYQMRVQNAQNAQSAAAAQQTNAAETQTAQTRQPSIREQYTPIFDEATEAMQKQALQDAINSSGAAKGMDETARVGTLREQMRSVDPSKRTASYNTMNKVWESEIDRIGNYIREKDSNWKDWGDEFDTSILDDYKPGVNVWV